MSTELLIVLILSSLMAWLDHRGRRATSEALQAVGEANKVLAEHARQAQIALTLVKGVAPHHADPATFTPRGVSYGFVEKVQQAEPQLAIRSDDVAMYEQAVQILTERGDADRAAEMKERLETAKKRVGMAG
jgi:DNA-binding LacI/PurR family transcriptional regulator